MCIIIDANCLGKFLKEPPDEDSEPVRKWLDSGQGRLVYSTGGKFANEIVGDARKKLRGYSQKGIATLVPMAKIGGLERQLAGHKELQSDDPHVLALALFAKVRLLYSHDKDLIKDFKNTEIITKIKKGKGKVYSRASKGNLKLLNESACNVREGSSN